MKTQYYKNKRRNLQNEPIEITKHSHTIQQIKKLRDTARRRKEVLYSKFTQHGKIRAIQNTWQNRKLAHGTKILTETEERNDMRPIWGYQKKLRATKTSMHTPLEKDDGALTQNDTEIMQQFHWRRSPPPHRSRVSLITVLGCFAHPLIQ